jgi:hypothetical protein
MLDPELLERSPDLGRLLAVDRPGLGGGEVMSAEIRIEAPRQAAFAVATTRPFTPIPGVDLDEVLCVQEERQVQSDNCVSYRTLKLQTPPTPLRPPFVKAWVKVHVYANGSHALFHGPRCIGRYDDNGGLKEMKDAA